MKQIKKHSIHPELLLLAFPVSAFAGNGSQDSVSILFAVFFLAVVAKLLWGGLKSINKAEERVEATKAIQRVLDGEDVYSELAVLLEKGELPEEDPDVRNKLPFILSRKEKFICAWENAEVFTLKKRFVHEGGSAGISVRVAKGVTIRTGKMAGQSIPVEQMESLGICFVLVTTNNIYYRTKDGRMKKLSTANVIGTTVYSDAVSVEFERFLPIVIKVPVQHIPILDSAVRYHNEWLAE